MTTPNLILGSTSRYRRELLSRLGIPFDCEAPGVEETHLPGEAPAARAKRLALSKAMAVAQRHPDRLVIGSDQVAECNGTILDKPGTVPAARAQLQRQSGQTVVFHGAVALVRLTPAARVEFMDITRVQFRTLNPDEIERYIEREEPLDCAGSFRSESLGISLLERVVTDDPTALIGLPLIALARALRSCGLALP